MVSERQIGMAGVLTAALLSLCHAAGADVKVDDRIVALSAGDMHVTLGRVNGQPSSGGLSVTEGTEARPVRFGGAEAWKLTDDAVSFRLRERDGELTVAIGFATDNALRIGLGFANASETQRLLEIGYAIPVPGNAETVAERTASGLPLSSPWLSKADGKR